MVAIRDIMTPDAQCIGESDTLTDAARLLRDLRVGAVPICGNDNRLKGMVTDRDITVRCTAEGGNPSEVTAGELGESKLVTVGADDSIEEAIRTMSEHKVRRLPVIDGHDLVGMVTQADVARSCTEDLAGELIEFISDADVT